MKKETLSIIFIMVIMASMSSCSHKIVGTWTINKFENSTPSEQGYSLSNIGTITFYKNGSGEKNINYSVLGTSHTDLFPFKWAASDAAITLVGDSTEFSKTWIVIASKRNYQQWKSTTGNKIQVLELKKN
ncbi:MAG: hypothetical protein IBJ16_10230 [Chitinophagaceae bacterium]|nr:hypothetical protein [Chitinophagaceae bacterium]